MGAEFYYWITLLVYVLLFACQMVFCQLTHALIILVDSYINLYRILDITIGIIHFRTQRQLASQNRSIKDQFECRSFVPSSASRVLGVMCTHSFKRLPLLGSFVNGCFLAALLMSAAIEGIQTCFHSDHTESSGEKAIIHTNHKIYPILLFNLAIVGLIMQYCSNKVHELRDKELSEMHHRSAPKIANTADGIQDSAISSAKSSCSSPQVSAGRGQSADRSDDCHLNGSSCELKELSAAKLISRSQQHLNDRTSSQLVARMRPKSRRSDQNVYDLNRTRESSFESIPSEFVDLKQDTCSVSLTSIKKARDLDRVIDSNDPSDFPVSVLRPDYRIIFLNDGQSRVDSTSIANMLDNKWSLVRYLTSPVAQVICALIVYLINDELVTEISDATLSICIVVLLYAASYPPMKKAGKILLQTAPDGIDLNRLEKRLKCLHRDILEVRNLKVWSLTPRANRIATCELILDKTRIHDGKDIHQLLAEARLIFQEADIQCTTIQPKFETKSS